MKCYVRAYVRMYVCNQSTGFVQAELRESESDCSTSVLQLYWFGSFSLLDPFSFRVQCIKWWSIHSPTPLHVSTNVR